MLCWTKDRDSYDFVQCNKGESFIMIVIPTSLSFSRTNEILQKYTGRNEKSP